ncbi:MAG: hypothetical protein JWM28_424, partial [Chitinophagaceae bacterium]|nr:hypothetical protein [Chitinophagaceae bacterium]
MIDKVPSIDTLYWNRLKKGDSQALGYFYDKYVDRLFIAAMRITDNRDLAKDALQEVFIELWNYRNTLSDITHTHSYLVKVMRSILIKKLKKESLISHSLNEESLVFSEQS